VLSKAKVLTRDNLAKRKDLDDKSCLFCNESESISHLFFDCCVAKVTWENVSEVCDRILGTDFESIAKLWFQDKKLKAIDIATTVTLWALWIFWNELCFQDVRWTGGGVILGKIANMLRDWKLLAKEEEARQLVTWAGELERKSWAPPQLTLEGRGDGQEHELNDELLGNPLTRYNDR
jgi:hypothetical protein